jgi:hypothetical protein
MVHGCLQYAPSTLLICSCIALKDIVAVLNRRKLQIAITFLLVVAAVTAGKRSNK